LLEDKNKVLYCVIKAYLMGFYAKKCYQRKSCLFCGKSLGFSSPSRDLKSLEGELEATL